MKTLRTLLLCLVPALASAADDGMPDDGTSHAQGIDESLVPNRTLADYISDYVDVPPGATDWRIFGETGQINIERRVDGLDYQYYKPEFTPQVRAMDGKHVIVKGFMFPLDETEAQGLFLIGPFPVSCPFQYHVGPSLVIEVHADKHPVKFSYDPVVVTGTLQLVAEDPENNVFYRLVDAQRVRR